jgi:hypothetical protein
MVTMETVVTRDQIETIATTVDKKPQAFFLLLNDGHWQYESRWPSRRSS